MGNHEGRAGGAGGGPRPREGRALWLEAAMEGARGAALPHLPPEMLDEDPQPEGCPPLPQAHCPFCWPPETSLEPI